MTTTPVIHRLTLFAALTLVLAAPAARADEAPPDDYVERCTVAKQQGAGELCVPCSDVRPAPAEERCEAKMAPQGYALRCSAWGATVAETVWCKADPNALAKPPADATPAKKPTCAASPATGLSVVAAVLGLLIIGRLGRARRRS